MRRNVTDTVQKNTQGTKYQCATNVHPHGTTLSISLSPELGMNAVFSHIQPIIGNEYCFRAA